MTDVFDGGTSPDDQTHWSIDGMKAAAAACPAVGPLPLLYDTSDYRDWPNKWHGWRQATDWGNNSDQVLGSQQQDDFARWWATFYGPWSLELIHVYSGGAPETTVQTEEWKNGQKMPRGWYGWPTLEGHRGHVHVAITNAGLAAAQAWWKAIGQATGNEDDELTPEQVTLLTTIAKAVLQLGGALTTLQNSLDNLGAILEYGQGGHTGLVQVLAAIKAEAVDIEPVLTKLENLTLSVKS